jgi:tetratricopeptide (TPR) repeat protein
VGGNKNGWAVLLFALSSAGAAPPVDAPGSTLDDARVRALALDAEALDSQAKGALDDALAKLLEAQRLAPDSPSIARDLALLHARQGQLELALSFAERAIALGEVEPEALELRARLLLELGRSEEAADSALAAESWGGDLLGAASGDIEALDRAAEYVGEDSARGMLTEIVLAADAGRRGARTSARSLAELAESTAARLHAVPELETARGLEDRLGHSAGLLAGGTRLVSSFDYATNPGYLADGTPMIPSGVRFTLTGEGALQAPIGRARVDAAVRIDQQTFLNDRSALADFDLSAYAVGLSVEVPINDSPAPVLLGVAVRFRDSYGREFQIHYGSVLDGGPTLTIPFNLNAGIELGMYGVSADYAANNPADNAINSQNRDFIGQRAVGAFVFRTGILDGRVETMFLRDDAVGAAFKSRGGALAGRVRTFLPGGIALFTGFALTLQQFGPVGDEAIIGPASKRTEARTVAELGVRAPLSEHFAAVVEDVWVRNSARAGHAYTDNLMTFALETRW